MRSGPVLMQNQIVRSFTNTGTHVAHLAMTQLLAVAVHENVPTHTPHIASPPSPAAPPPWTLLGHKWTLPLHLPVIQKEFEGDEQHKQENQQPWDATAASAWFMYGLATQNDPSLTAMKA